MKSKVVALLLSDLGVTKTHSRPHVSDDNPFSEAQFKTLKYRPDSRNAFASRMPRRSAATSSAGNVHYHSGLNAVRSVRPCLDRRQRSEYLLKFWPPRDVRRGALHAL